MMRQNDPLAAAIRGLSLAAVLLAALAGCTPTEKAMASCEPGVAELSETATVVPGGC